MGARQASFLIVTAIAGLMLGPSLRNAFADTTPANCKPELRAEGRRSDPGSAEEKAADALKLSISKWEQLAQGLHGNQFASWQSAKERKIECEHYDQPGLNGRVSCVAIALPCDRH